MSIDTHPLRAVVAEEIRAAMGRRRMSAVRLGRQIGRSQSYMSRRLTGELPFDTDDLDAIAIALDVEISQLLSPATRQYLDNLDLAA